MWHSEFMFSNEFSIISTNLNKVHVICILKIGSLSKCCDNFVLKCLSRFEMSDRANSGQLHSCEL